MYFPKNFQQWLLPISERIQMQFSTKPSLHMNSIRISLQHSLHFIIPTFLFVNIVFCTLSVQRYSFQAALSIYGESRFLFSFALFREIASTHYFQVNRQRNSSTFGLFGSSAEFLL